MFLRQSVTAQVCGELLKGLDTTLLGTLAPVAKCPENVLRPPRALLPDLLQLEAHLVDRGEARVRVQDALELLPCAGIDQSLVTAEEFSRAREQTAAVAPARLRSCATSGAITRSA